MGYACYTKYKAFEEIKEKKSMQNRLKVAVVAGGDSSEYVISIQSGEEITKNLNEEKYEVYTIIVKGTEWFVTNADSCDLIIDKNDFSFNLNGQRTTFDVIFIAIHGTPGEDGKLQAYFDLLGLPYTTCDRLTSSLTFNKYFCNSFLQNKVILCANSLLLRKDDRIDIKKITNDIKLPCFVKPNSGGSSFGISKVNNEDELLPSVKKAFEEDSEVIIEEFIEGTEITCGIFKSKGKSIILPLTEIVSHNDFFDYEAKYDGKSDEITPAGISESDTKKCQELASKIYDVINCKGIVRIDFILHKNEFYMLEINTVPGMTKNSIVPQMANVYGISLENLYDLVIQDAIERNS